MIKSKNKQGNKNIHNRQNLLKINLTKEANDVQWKL